MAREVKVVISGDASSLNKAFGAAGKDAEGFSARMSKIGDGMTRFGKGLTLGVTLPLIAIGKKALDASGEAQLVAAQTAAALKSTGGAAHVTAKQIEELAKAIDKKSLADDEAIQSGANLLLTFTNIQNRVGEGNDIFNQATQAIADMSQAMGTDLSTTAIQVGKALQDPIQGVTALQRVGVKLTEQQKDQVAAMMKAGDVAGAQKVILEELNREFGGSAAAAADTAIGRRKQALDELGNTLERIGDIIAPFVEKGAAALTRLLERFQALTPQQQEFGIKMAGLAAALGPALIIFGKVASAIGAIGTIMGGVTLAGLAMAAFWIIIAAAVIALVIVIVKNWDTIKTFLFDTWESIKATAAAAWNWIFNAASAAFSTIAQVILGPFVPLKATLGLVWETIKAVAIVAWNILKGAAQGIWSLIKLVIVGPMMDAKAILIAAFNAVRDSLLASWNAIKSGLAAAANFVGSKFEWLRDKIAGIVNAIRGLIAGLPFMHNSPSEMEISANITTANVVDKMKSLASGVTDALSGTGFGGFGGGTSPNVAAAAASSLTVPITINGATIDEIVAKVRASLEKVAAQNGGKVFAF